MKHIIYKLTDGSGKCYVGRTTTSLKARLKCHKHKKNYPFDWENIKIEQIEITENGFEREIFWISKIANVNKSTGGKAGMSGVKKTKEACLKHSKMIKKMWKHKRHIFEKTLKNLDTSKNKQSERANKRNLIQWSKMPKYIAIEKKTGIIFGPYQGYKIASNEISHTDETIGLMLREKRHSSKYYFEYLSGENHG